MNIREAADFLRVSVSLIEKLRHQRRIKGAKIGRRLVFRLTDLEHFVGVQAMRAA